MDGEDIIGLYDRHARQLLGFFMRRTRDPQLALDLLGETFLAVFENRPRRGPRDEERAAWLFRIAADKLAGHFRAGRSERRVDHAARDRRTALSVGRCRPQRERARRPARVSRGLNALRGAIVDKPERSSHDPY
jgi:DNA-directed RNA polymerase specialized sigma24 family protein